MLSCEREENPPNYGARPRNGQSRLQGINLAGWLWSIDSHPRPLVIHLPTGLSQWEAPSDNRRRVKEQRGPTHAQPAQVHEIVVESHSAHSCSLSSSCRLTPLYLFTPAVAMSLWLLLTNHKLDLKQYTLFHSSAGQKSKTWGDNEVSVG